MDSLPYIPLVRTHETGTKAEDRGLPGDGAARSPVGNARKAYPIAPGLIPVFDRSGGANLGHALETAIALQLNRRGAEIA